MASDIVLGTSIGAVSGTGDTYKPRGGDPVDSVSYESGSGVDRKILVIKRTLPKPTSNFPGVYRSEVVLTEYKTVNAIEYPCVLRFTTSLPAVIDETAKDLLWQHFMQIQLAAGAAAYRAAVSGRLPT